MNNAKLRAIAEQASKDLVSFIEEGEEDILKAFDAVAEEAQNQETVAKMRLGFSIVLDLDADKMETALTFGIRRKLSRDANIPDPDQSELKLSE